MISGSHRKCLFRTRTRTILPSVDFGWLDQGVSEEDVAGG